MVGSGILPDDRRCEGIRAMNEMAVDERLENLDLRLTRIEQILPTLASKKDLEAFATKKDLEAFATKKDLEAFATKKDLDEGLDEVRRYMRVLYEDLVERIRLLGEKRPKRR